MSNVSVNTNETERFCSVEEIAEHIGCSKYTIRAWVKKGAIPYHKIGRYYKFRLSEVNDWVESGKSADADKDNKEVSDND